MKPRTVDEWVVVLDLIEAFLKELRESDSDERRHMLDSLKANSEPSPPQDDIVAELSVDEIAAVGAKIPYISALTDYLSDDQWNNVEQALFTFARAIAALGAKGWQRNRLRCLVDDVWQAATDSQEVPSVSWADELIDEWLASPPIGAS